MTDKHQNMANFIYEIRTQDQDWMSGQYVKADETRAAHDIFANTTLSSELQELLAEYETRQTLEAKIVKDADRLDLYAEVQEVTARGTQLTQHWQKNGAKIDMLYTQTASKIASKLETTFAFDWPNTVHDQAVQNINQFGTTKNVA